MEYQIDIEDKLLANISNEYQKICQIKYQKLCQMECQIDIPDRMLEDMTERMSDRYIR